MKARAPLVGVAWYAIPTVVYLLVGYLTLCDGIYLWE
jgi:hypothetical protein